MNKIIEINGHKYSRQEFEDYKLRVKFEFEMYNGDYHNIDIYTTQEDKNEVYMTVSEKQADSVKCIEIVNVSTKEQDDLTSKFIEETLGDW